MATPTTVLEFAQVTRDADSAARTSAHATLATAQTTLAAARTALAAATAALATKEKEVAAKRAEVAEADTPAEGTALLAQLTALTAAMRTLQAGQVAARAAVAEAEGIATVAAAGLGRAIARLARAEAELVAATADAALRTAWVAAATAPPLDTLLTDSTDALDDDPYDAATTAVTGAIPARLLEAARRGLESEAARATRLGESQRAAEDLLVAELVANGGVAGAVAGRRIELDRAERDLRDWSERARGRYDRALVLFESLAVGDSVLNAHESARVTELDEDPAQDAADLRVSLLEARDAELDAQLDVEEATYAALAADPAADLATVAAVTDAEGLLDDATGALGIAQGLYDAVAADFTGWTAEVPDSAWRKVLSYLEAEALLDGLGEMDDADVTALVEAVGDAEAALAAALAAEEAHANAVAFLEAYVTLRADRVTRSGATDPARLLGAVRGDT